MEKSGGEFKGLSLTRAAQGEQGAKGKKHFAENPSKNLLSKVTETSAESWGLMVKGEVLGGHGGVSVELGRKVSEGWKKVLTRGEGACEVPVKALELSRRWRSHGNAEQQEGITVRFVSKWDCGNFMRLVKMDRGYQVSEGREGAEDHAQMEEVGSTTNRDREPASIAINFIITQCCILLP